MAVNNVTQDFSDFSDRPRPRAVCRRPKIPVPRDTDLFVKGFLRRMFAMDAQIECNDVAKWFNGILVGGFEVERFEGERMADFGDRILTFGNRPFVPF
jgi:hypothetical protein